MCFAVSHFTGDFEVSPRNLARAKGHAIGNGEVEGFTDWGFVYRALPSKNNSGPGESIDPLGIRPTSDEVGAGV